jgi:biotin operon repressor
MRPNSTPIKFVDVRVLLLLREQLFHSAYSIDDVLWIFRSTILNQLQE